MKKLISAYVITFVFCFMLFIYEPILLYSTNINDFWFDLGIMIIPVLKIFSILLITGCLLFTIVYFINKKFSKDLKIYNILLLIVFFMFFVFYIQGNYLIGHLPVLDGNVIEWNNFKIDNIITIVIFIILSIISIISVFKLKLEKTIKYATYLSLAIFIMLSVSLTSTLLTTDAFEEKDGVNVTDENINTISKNKNFLIFMLDAVDSASFYKVLNNSEEYKDLFTDFTYYPDTLSAYPFTRDSIPFVLSGIWNNNEKSFGEYSSYAFNNSPLFANLTEQGYKINLYDAELVWNGSRNYNIENVVSNKNSNINLKLFFKQELKYILFKYLPYNLKRYSRIEHMHFNVCIEKFRWDNILVYETIKQNPTLKKEASNYFQFIHTEGAHVPFNYDKDLNIIENGTYDQKIEASLKLIKSYIDRLKNNKTYDNSVIIIMADHGYHGTGGQKTLLYRFNPILLIKGINESHAMLESQIPISYEDLQDAYTELLEGKKSTELFQNLNQNRTRKMLWYIYTEENHMVEYETNGKAYEPSKFKETGNIYDR